MQTKVAIIKCPSYEETSVKNSLQNMLEYWDGMKHFIATGQKVLIKPNLLAPHPPEKLTTTHPSVVAGVIELIKDSGGIPVVGDKPVFGSAARACKAAGIDEVCKRYGAQIIEFTKHKKLSEYQDHHYGTLGIATEILEADVIINLPKLKVHEQLYFSLGVKNMFGGVSLGRRVWRHWISEHKLEEFAQMLVSTYQIAPPAFTIVDGITAMETRGPAGGTPNNMGILVGGQNAIAVDRVIMEIVSSPWQKLPTLSAAQKMGLSGHDLSEIEVCGSPIQEVQVTDFKFPQISPVDFSISRSVKIVLRKLWKNIFPPKSTQKNSY